MKIRDNHKISNIVRVLCHYFLSKSSSEIHITVKPQPGYLCVSATGNVNITKTELDTIKSLLDQAKTPEMEYYYDDLLLTDVNGNEFTLLGAMVDDTQVTYIDGILEVELHFYLPDTD
jgi:hypothetical protein